MTKIGLISDTHGFLDDTVYGHFKDCDEIWHAGDFGNVHLAEKLSSWKPLKGVYGNIDGHDVRSQYPEKMIFYCEEVKVMVIHIGGSPPKYSPGIKNELTGKKINLFISGHSHILKAKYDDSINCLHINPGAAGNHGWHKIKTVIRFSIDGTKIMDCEVIELGLRGSLAGNKDQYQ